MVDETVLSVRGLRKAYGSLLAVDGVSFEARPGEVVGLLGPNGAGKTSTINMVLGLLAPDAGSVTVCGFDIARRRADALERTGFAAAYAALPGNLTVAENLSVFGMLYGVRGLEARITELTERFDLDRLRGARAGVLSSGEQTRLCLAKALLNSPRLLLLDEPTASLDPASARDVRARIREYAASAGCAVLWTSHNMREMEEVCGRVLFLSRGRLLLAGDPRTLPAANGKATLEELFIALAREPLSLEDAP
ncbi:MAG: ABC transporter ATP-binding protein [Elusimicrobia bacterium]|nr:ABC transporter ATP-binding protein [Elusimicrobiota bacterium]